MALSMSIRDATREVMRGNMDKKAVQRDIPERNELPPPKAEVSPPPAQDNTAVADAVANVATALSSLGQANIQNTQVMAETLRQLQPKEQQAKAWKFTVTERDRMGNIVSFTAAPT
jgi:hypothetical protein